MQCSTLDYQCRLACDELDNTAKIIAYGNNQQKAVTTMLRKQRSISVALMRTCSAVLATSMLMVLAACGDNISPSEQAASEETASQFTGNYQGSGASSQQTAVEAWIAGFQRSNPRASIAYNPTGSGAGVTTFLTGATAWAGSDKLLTDEQLKQSSSVCARGTAFEIPVYVSPIALAFNLKGVSDQGKHINMDASTIAKVFDGKITQWDDPALVAMNPHLRLPNMPITVVHRSDKSGTTLNFVSYLKDVVPDDWKYPLSENWPNNVGQGAKGASGVVSTLRLAEGTIGYADFSQVGKLGTVAVKVGDTFNSISPQAGSLTIADSRLETNKSTPGRVAMSINHATTQEDAYPIVVVSYNVACRVYKDAQTGRFAKSWLAFVASNEGQRIASAASGAAPLPEAVLAEINNSIQAMSVS